MIMVQGFIILVYSHLLKAFLKCLLVILDLHISIGRVPMRIMLNKLSRWIFFELLQKIGIGDRNVSK